MEVGRKTRSPDRTPSVLAAPKVLSGADAACAQRPANLPRVSRGGEGSRDESAERDVVTRDAEKQVYFRASCPFGDPSTGGLMIEFRNLRAKEKIFGEEVNPKLQKYTSAQSLWRESCSAWRPAPGTLS